MRRKAQEAGNLKTDASADRQRRTKVRLSSSNRQVRTSFMCPITTPTLHLWVSRRTLARILSLVGRFLGPYLLTSVLALASIRCSGFGWGWPAWGFDWGRREACCIGASVRVSTATHFTIATPTFTGTIRGSAPYARGDRGARGFGAPAGRESMETRSGAFGGISRGGDARGYSSRGSRSFGGGGFGGGFGGGARGGGFGGGARGGGGRR